MTRPEFEEKTFEVAVNTELARREYVQACPACGGEPCCISCGEPFPMAALELWAPGQVLEKLLGFDLAVATAGNPDLLGVLLPDGADWKQHIGDPAGAGTAPKWVSLFLQYKRCDHLSRRHGEALKKLTAPLYRFALDHDQNMRLKALRDATNGEALVWYVAPRFHTASEMVLYRQLGNVLGHVFFVEPAVAADGNPPHDHVAMDAAGGVHFCSEPVAARRYDVEDLEERANELGAAPTRDASSSDSLRLHLGRLDEALRGNDPAALQPPDMILRIAHRVHEAGARWMLVAVTP